MENINLFGGGFQHAHSSTWWKRAKYINWIKNQYSSDITFYVDDAIKTGLVDGFKGKKYAWIHESRVFHQMTDFVKQNHKTLENTFELIFTHDDSLVNLNPYKFIFIPGNGFWIETPKIYPKNKLLSMITSGKNQTVGHRLRNQTMSKYAKYVDLYGRGVKPIEKKEEALNDYMFSFAIENDNYDTYFSEKILDCFATGTIPIYWGTKNISKYFNQDGIIHLQNFNISDITPELYHSKLDVIKENFEKVLELEIPEDYIYKNYLSI